MHDRLRTADELLARPPFPSTTSAAATVRPLPAAAEPAAAADAPPADAAASTSGTGASCAERRACSGPEYIPFYDNDFELEVPSSWTYFEVPIPVVGKHAPPRHARTRLRMRRSAAMP